MKHFYPLETFNLLRVVQRHLQISAFGWSPQTSFFKLSIWVCRSMIALSIGQIDRILSISRVYFSCWNKNAYLYSPRWFRPEGLWPEPAWQAAPWRRGNSRPFAYLFKPSPDSVGTAHSGNTDTVHIKRRGRRIRRKLVSTLTQPQSPSRYLTCQECARRKVKAEVNEFKRVIAPAVFSLP